MASNVSTDQSANTLENSEIGKIIDIISSLRNRVHTQTSPGNSNNKGEKVVGEDQNNPPASAPVDDGTIEQKNNNKIGPLKQLDHDLIYMRYALEKLKDFEGGFGKSIRELKDDLEIILASLATKNSDPEIESQLDEIRRIYQKFLNLKSKIPAVQGISASDTDEQQRRRINQSKELPNMPDKPRFKQHGFFKELETKFDALDEVKSLCLLCFAVFPENAVIKKRLLLHWWMGEGFISKLTRNNEPAEAVADDLLLEFEKKGFIVPVDKKHRKVANSFSMSPLVRSAVITLAIRGKFFDFDYEGIPTLSFKDCERACLVYDHKEASIQQRLDQLVVELAAKELTSTELKAKNVDQLVVKLAAKELASMELKAKNDDDQNLTEAEIDQKAAKFAESMALFNFNEKPEQKYYEFEKIMEIFNKRLKLDLEDIEKRAQELAEDIEKKARELADTRSKIKTLFNVSEENPEFKYEWFSKMVNIKVLYLGRWQSRVNEIPHIEVENTEYLKGLKSMKSLRLLSLQGISGIRELPKEISYLKALEILDIRAGYTLEKLPAEIDMLKNLTHLDISECFLLDGIPKKLCKLSKLQVLKGFVITYNDKDRHHSGKQWCRLEDLEGLKQLRKLSININSEKFDTEKLSVVLKFAELLELKVKWGGGSSPAKSTVLTNADEKKPKSGESPNAPRKSCNWICCLIEKLGGNPSASQVKFQSKLKKLDLQCFPVGNQPDWLTPENLNDLECLYIRGGRLNSLRKHEWKKVRVLRLKYLNELQTDWKKLQDLFPKLEYLEKFKCHKVTLCPCDGHGVWEKTELDNQYDSR